MHISSDLLKIWSFQSVPSRHMIFLVLSGKLVFFPQKHDLSTLGRKQKTAFPRKYIETWRIAQQKKNKKRETWYLGSKFGLSLNLSGWRYSTMSNLQYLVPFRPQGPCFRSNHQACSVKNGVLRNFEKSTGKPLCQGLFFNKVAGACNFIKKEALAQGFSCGFFKISKNTIFYRTRLVVAPETRSLRSKWYKVLKITHCGISPTG